MCGFIHKYVPFNANENSLLARYCIGDAYLQFYYKFIHPIAKDIQQGKYNSNPTAAIKSDDYYRWLGYAFERMCRNYHHVIAKMLGFAAVQYQAGSYFSRATNAIESGYQIDLVFDRKDQVYSICEIKYQRLKIGKSIIDEFEKKLRYFPNKSKYSIHKVLISLSGVDNSVAESGYFDNILTLEDFFNRSYWE
jgi:uncharacterized protein